MQYTNLNPVKALIWRIIHRDNLEWVLQHGLYAGSHEIRSDSWVNIGSEELIDKRSRKEVPIHPGGNLNDYVPFYFTPFSPMMLNIKTGIGGVIQRSNEELLILVSSLHDVSQSGHEFVFTDSHAYSALASYYSDVKDLHKIDWPILQSRDFKRDNSDLQKIERYQAEALIHSHMPVSLLKGIVCYNKEVESVIKRAVARHEHTLTVHTRSNWYF